MAKDIPTGLQVVALIRGLVEAALYENDALQYGFNGSCSANDNRATLSDALEVDLNWLVSPAELGSQTARDAVMQGGKSFDKGMKELQDRMLQYVPVGYSTEECGTLPRELVNAVGYGAVRGALTFR